MTPFEITFIGSLGVLIYFLIYGIIHKTDSTAFFNCNKQLRKTEFGDSFAAASTSLATVLFFFVTLGLENGLYILISPLSYYCGIYLYNKLIVPKLELYGFGDTTQPSHISLGDTLGKFIESRYGSKSVKIVISIITILGIISILLIELFVGVEIFNIFLKTEYKEAALILIAIVAFIYTGLGGLNTVVQTDKLQFRFMLVVATGIVVYLFFQKPPITLKDFLPTPMSLSNGLLLEWPLLLNVMFVNILLIPSLLRNWQLISATKDYNEVKKGLMHGFYLTAIISTLFVVLGILYFKLYPQTEVSLNGILISMANSNLWFLSYILMPLLFIACLMALLSTVDSSLLPIVQSITCDFSKEKEKKPKYLRLTFVLLIITLFLYWVVFKMLHFDLINWLYTIFSLVTVSCPVIVFACIGNSNVLRTKTMRITSIVSTIIGLIITLGLSYYGNLIQDIWCIQLNTPIATFIVFAILTIVYCNIKNHSN